MRISDWSSDVCSSDLASTAAHRLSQHTHPIIAQGTHGAQAVYIHRRSRSATRARTAYAGNPRRIAPGTPATAYGLRHDPDSGNALCSDLAGIGDGHLSA